ncbi:hypothetical protein K0B04_02675 [Patescibacteria group bacterium]|nr:hypothetical protein [Patescibacteria group bacterium]
MFFEILIEFIGMLISLGHISDTRITNFKNQEEREDWEKERNRILKQKNREWHENWMNVERPRLIREAGLDPTKPEDVNIWKAQRKAENKIKRAKKATEDLEMLEQQRARYRQLEQSSDSSHSHDYPDWSDKEYAEWKEREDNKLTLGKFIGSLFFD